jgi:hypothetical protein
LSVLTTLELSASKAHVEEFAYGTNEVETLNANFSTPYRADGRIISHFIKRNKSLFSARAGKLTCSFQQHRQSSFTGLSIYYYEQAPDVKCSKLRRVENFSSLARSGRQPCYFSYYYATAVLDSFKLIHYAFELAAENTKTSPPCSWVYFKLPEPGKM